MSRIEDRAICIRVWEWSETSQTVCLLTHQHGLLRGLAKGSRRVKSAFSGGFEMLTLGDVGAILKPTRELALLTHWDLRWTLPQARRSLEIFHAGLYAADLAGRLVQDQDPHPGLFKALQQCLEQLPEQPTIALLRFQWAALTDTGHRPELWHNAKNGDPINQAHTLGFDPRLGGLVPDPGPRASGGGGPWRVRAETVELLRNLHTDTPPDPLDAIRASRLLNAYASEVLGRTIPSAEALFGPTPS